MHRHTVRNRIQRAAQLTGHDLDSIDTQTELWLALKARGHEHPEDPAAPLTYKWSHHASPSRPFVARGRRWDHGT